MIGMAGVYTDVATVLYLHEQRWKTGMRQTYATKPYKAGSAVWNTLFDIGQF